MDAIERSALLEKVEVQMRVRDFQKIVQILETFATDELLQEPHLGFYAALAQSHTGRDADASLLIKQLIQQVRNFPKSRLLLRCLNLEGALLMEAGDLTGACERFDEVLSSAYDIEDRRFVAAAAMNLSTLAAMRHQWDRAILDLTRAMAVSTSAGLRHQVGGCHHNLGMVFRETNFFSRSVTHFERASKLFELWGTREEHVATEYEWSFALARSGQLQLATTKASRALASTRSIGNPRLEGEALRVLGTICMYTGEMEEAKRHLKRSRVLARDLSVPLLMAETAELLEIIARRDGRTSQAAKFRTEADTIYETMGIPYGKALIWFPQDANSLPLQAC